MRNFFIIVPSDCCSHEEDSLVEIGQVGTHAGGRVGAGARGGAGRGDGGGGG